MVVQTIMRVVDGIVIVVGLLLILRLVLRLFKVPSTHPAMAAVIAVTNPIQKLVRRMLGITSYSSGYASYPRVASDVIDGLVALVALWITRTVVMWVLSLVAYLPGWIANPAGSVAAILGQLVRLVFEVYELALFSRIIFEWMHVPYYSGVMRFLWKITEPVLAPIRRLLPPFGGLDFSPLLAFFLLRLLETVVLGLLFRIL